MNHAVKILEQRRDELTDGPWSIAEQHKNLANLREAVERAESNLAECELGLEQMDAAIRALAVSE